MPQKAVLTRAPLMDAAMCALSRGQARTDSRELATIYRMLEETGEATYTWEALFSLACLLTDHPTDETVAGRILSALGDTQTGVFETGSDQQLDVARAALAMYEYTTDRGILKRLARWCGWLEADWDKMKNCRWIRIQPADLMSFLVRFYRITGLKAVLRLCSRLRSSAMDWTTVLHNFHQRNPLSLPEMEKETESLFALKEYSDLDFQAMQYLSNHAEILADGVRYTVWSAVYSGNGQEITAGRKGWETLKKFHGAVCGGTTGSVFLGGRGTDRGIHAASTAAWMEAMIVQMQASASPWAMNEAVRLLYNALEDCINHARTIPVRYVNTTDGGGNAKIFDPETDPERSLRTMARLARAAAMAWQNAVTVSSDGINLNYLLTGRYMISCGGQNAVLLCDKDALHIRCRTPFEMNLNIFYAASETAQIELQTAYGAEKKTVPNQPEGRMIRIRRTWENLDTLTFHQDEKICVEEVAHRGICILVRNRIMSLNTQDGEYRYAISGNAFIRNGQVFARVTRIPRWPVRNGIPSDIPVLPGGNGEAISAPLTPYAETICRISVFPRESNYV